MSADVLAARSVGLAVCQVTVESNRTNDNHFFHSPHNSEDHISIVTQYRFHNIIQRLSCIILAILLFTKCASLTDRF